MNPIYKFKSTISFTLLLVVLGCTSMINWATRKPVLWSQAVAEWNQPTIESSQVIGHKLEVVLRINTDHLKMRSANIYPEITKVSTRIDGTKIFIQFFHSTVARPCKPQVVFKMKVPPPGEYSLVYDDSSAGFPRLGAIHVD